MSHLRYRPTQDYILVRPLERKQSNVLTVISREKHCRGEVVAVGPGIRNKRGQLIPLDTCVGDIIIFGDGNFDFWPPYIEDSVTYRVLQEADVVGVLESANIDVLVPA